MESYISIDHHILNDHTQLPAQYITASLQPVLNPRGGGGVHGTPPPKHATRNSRGPGVKWALVYISPLTLYGYVTDVFGKFMGFRDFL